MSNGKDFLSILGVIIILFEILSFLISIMPGRHFITEILKNPSNENIIENMNWIADFLYTQVFALPGSLITSVIINLLRVKRAAL